ncbi:MAG: hypothetical protein BEN19_04425 [Epulopiscium sp. Nuni2H_MBin003]|nr:MAG: hypothetical protein BEN19_04425 [Epulopiscium sp. Nuni2H_MBin003]
MEAQQISDDYILNKIRRSIKVQGRENINKKTTTVSDAKYNTGQYYESNTKIDFRTLERKKKSSAESPKQQNIQIQRLHYGSYRIFCDSFRMHHKSKITPKKPASRSSLQETHPEKFTPRNLFQEAYFKKPAPRNPF